LTKKLESAQANLPILLQRERVEEWKNGRMEEWKNGRMEEWKIGRVGILPSSNLQPSIGVNVTRPVTIAPNAGKY
jgi:hypothetical protein